MGGEGRGAEGGGMGGGRERRIPSIVTHCSKSLVCASPV